MAGGRRAQRQSRSAGLLVTHQSLLPSFLPSFCILCLLVFTSTILSTGIVQNSVRLPKKVSSLPCMMMHAKTVLLVLHVDRSSNLQSFCTACLHVHTLCVCVCVCVCTYHVRSITGVVTMPRCWSSYKPHACVQPGRSSYWPRSGQHIYDAQARLVRR